MIFSLLLFLFTTLVNVRAKAVAPVNSISMKIVNNAGAPIELFWKNIYTTPIELVKQTQKPVRNSSDVSINSYDTHEFVIMFLDGKRKQQGEFAKGPKEEVITVGFDTEKNEFTIKQSTKFDEIMDTIRVATDECANLRGDAFSKCVADGVADDITRITEAKSTLVKYRDVMSSRLRNYTCIDETMETSEPERTYPISILGKTYDVNVMMDMPHSKIWTVDNFVTPEECAVLEKHGRPLLRRATVAAEDGSSVVSEHRKAQQASYNFHQQNPGKDPLWPLYNRVLAITNRHAGMRLQPPGQEDFTIIQYNPDDQYTPHCDGQCNNELHISGGRVATAVIYCKVAERGGATTFTKADIFVKPTVGQATFFSYKGADGRMDDGYTEHSGCPVIEGEKLITTVWMREGVTQDDPWTNFDPSGIRMMSDEDYGAQDEDQDVNGEEFESSERTGISEEL